MLFRNISVDKFLYSVSLCPAEKSIKSIQQNYIHFVKCNLLYRVLSAFT